MPPSIRLFTPADYHGIETIVVLFLSASGATKSVGCCLGFRLPQQQKHKKMEGIHLSLSGPLLLQHSLLQTHYKSFSAFTYLLFIHSIIQSFIHSPPFTVIPKSLFSKAECTLNKQPSKKKLFVFWKQNHLSMEQSFPKTMSYFKSSPAISRL